MSHRANITIIGAGLMGHGLAQVFARAGHRVRVYDAMPASLDTLHARIAQNLKTLEEPDDCLPLVSGHADLAEALQGAGFVFEAAPEKLDIKRMIFADLERLAPADAVLASNTSVMPIGSIVEGLATRARMLGTHWWNPPFLVPLVEVVGTPDTAEDVIDATMKLLAAAGKTPVRVMKDVAGFVGNRLQHALWREAIALVEQGICDARTVDTVVKASFGRRLAVLGPLENADLIGTDLSLDIHRTVIQHLDRTPGPSPYLQGLVDAGRLGVKTGEGFRTWTEQEAQDLRAQVFAHLRKLNAAERGQGVADDRHSEGED
ncbi:MAG: NAD(P)-binding domain-containing protein [Beijerinckiaceae bacterium]|nr:NAD(P)-binding domain-containing protein [Beijerinckiaceae bacterium]